MAASSRDAGRQRGMLSRGFTMVELLAVIAVLILLLALVMAGVDHARKVAGVSRIKYQLTAITSGLEVYKQDYGTYPIVDPNSPDPQARKGAYVLAKWLLGPGDDDGAPGWGFRVRDPISGQYTGAIHAPILNKDQFRLMPDPAQQPANQKVGPYQLLDYYGGVFQYYPRKQINAQVNPNPVLCAPYGGPNAGGSGMFDPRDGDVPQNLLLYTLGDDNYNNRIDGTEHLRFSGEFILASPGSDGQFDPSNRDDIFNFDR